MPQRRVAAAWVVPSLNRVLPKGYRLYGNSNSRKVANLVSFRAQLLLSVPDDPLELLNALHHLGHGSCAVDELAHLRVRELVGGDERDQADGLSRAFGIDTHARATRLREIVVDGPRRR